MKNLALILIMVLAASACCEATTSSQPKDQSPSVARLSSTVTRVCDGPNAIYKTDGQWTTTHTIVANDPACGFTK